MISPWSETLAALDRALGPGTAARRLRRAEVSETGELWLTLGGDEGLAWLCARGGDLREARPSEDTALPAVARLTEAERAGEARILSWRPGRRIVARVEDARGLRIVKGYRESRLATAWMTHGRAAQRASSGSFRIPRLLGEEPGLSALAFDVLPGEPFDATAAAPQAWREVGRRLTTFQGTDPRGLPVHGRAGECAVLDRASARIAPVAGSPTSAWVELRRRLGVLAEREVNGLVPVHRDLHEGQILLGDHAPALLDFDLLGQGERALDVANLATHARVRALERAARDPSPELLEGYGPRGDPRFLEAYAFYTASTALRLAVLSELRPAWTPLIPEILAIARRALEDCERA